MGKIKRVLRCYHCGAILQSNDPNEEGYIDKEVLNGVNPKIPYCNRCYEKMQSLNASVLNLQVEQDVIKVLKDANATDAIIIWVVDLFSFNGTISPEIAKKVKKLNVVVIGNKKDLLPSSVKDAALTEFIKERFNAVGIEPISISIFGDENDVDCNKSFQALQKLRKGHDVYMIGSSQSGKTTLINKLLTSYKNKTKWAIKSEFYPETTLRVLEIPFDNSSFFYELPGWPLATSVVSKVEKDVLKYIIPRKRINHSAYTLAPKESILVGGLASFSLLNGKNTSFRLFASNDVESKKVKTNRLNDVLEENYHKRTIRPVSDRFTSFGDYDMFEFEMDNDGKLHDISIEGLCWVSFIAKGQTIRVMLPKNVSIQESLSKIGRK